MLTRTVIMERATERRQQAQRLLARVGGKPQPSKPMDGVLSFNLAVGRIAANLANICLSWPRFSCFLRAYFLDASK